MSANFTQEQLAQLNELFAGQLAARLAEEAATQRAQIEAQVGARFDALQAHNAAQQAAGAGLEQQVSALQQQLREARQQFADEQERSRTSQMISQIHQGSQCLSAPQLHFRCQVKPGMICPVAHHSLACRTRASKLRNAFF